MQILLAESQRFSETAMAALRAVGRVQAEDLDRLALIDAVADCDVLWVRLRHRIDREVLEAGLKLRFIVSPTTGLNHIDLEAAEDRGITVLSLKGETAFLDSIRATAEHTMALTLALLRNLQPALDHVTHGGWNRDLFRGGEIMGKTVGLVGYGRLGRRVAEFFEAFGATVLTHDPLVDLDEPCELDDLLSRSDIVSLHVSLDASTEGFFGRKQFDAMKRGALFINTSRGELIDEDALLDGLRNGHLAGAGLDVLVDETSEGMAEHRLVQYAAEHPHLLITPHIGGCTRESMEQTEIFMAEKLCAALS